jgi:hypothetical protein
VYYKLDRNAAYTASENLIAADIKTLFKYIELNYPDWIVGTINDLGAVFDVVDGDIVNRIL